jgi:hypothetical protein
MHDRRSARAGSVTDRVRRLVFMCPQHAPGFFIETQHAFHPRNATAIKRIGRIGRVRGQFAIVNVHTPARDGRPGVTGSDGSAPAEGQTVGGKLFQNAGLAPDGVALRSEPLRPIIRPGERQAGEQQCGAREPAQIRFARMEQHIP